MGSKGEWTLRTALLGLVWIAGCSTSNHLRKFEEGDISKEVSADMAKRFQVKDSAAPAPTPAPAAGAMKEKRGKSGKAKKVKEEQNGSGAKSAGTAPFRRLNPMPFEVGEKLAYDLRFVGVTAASFNMEVRPVKFIDDHQVYEIGAHAKTVKLFEFVYRVDDEIRSFWDHDGLYSHRFSMDLDETKQTRKLIELYDYTKNQSFFWNRIDHVEKGFREEKQYHDIQPWSQDPLSMLYYLRVAPLPVTPEGEFRAPVVLDGKPWTTVVRYLRTESIYAAGQSREARVYRIENYAGSELKNKDNTLWISTDEHRYILRVETKLRVGSFAVALDRIL